MKKQFATRKLAAIFYADAAGYSRLTGKDELGTHNKLMEALDLASSTIDAGGGVVLRYAGDAILAEFPSVVAAVNAAADIQNSLRDRNRDIPEDSQVKIRIGINLGEVLEDRGEIFGDGVNTAARLESTAIPGGVCISSSVFDQIKGKVDTNFRDCGLENLKNIADPVQIYRWEPTVSNGSNDEISDGADTGKKPSIAVLAFNNMSGDPEHEYLAEGISEDIITALSKIRVFTVIARNSTFTYKGKAVDIKQIAIDLDVGYVLEGSVRKSGNRVRITAQLIDSAGHHVWAEKYDREIDDIFELQDEMTQTIAAALEPELNAVERERAASKAPGNLGAWEYYQRALWNMWHFEEAKLEVAMDLNRQAIKLDPGFAAAYAYQSYCNYIFVVMGFSTNPAGHLEEGLELAKKAMKLDSREAIAYFAIGRIHMMLGNHDDSIAALEKSLELNPNFAQSYHGLGFVLALSGELDRAKSMTEKAIALSPRDPLMMGFTTVHALTCILCEEYEEALEWARRAMRLPVPSGYWGPAPLAAAYAHLGQMEAAGAAVKAALDAKPDLSISYLKKTFPTKLEGGLDPYLSGLRMAGLPE
jgi:adenylate cyclase